MKQQVNPAVFWVVLVVLLVAVIGIGYKALNPTAKTVTEGSETDMARVKKGEALYKPPANAPVPGGAGAGGASNAPGGAAGMYNLKPPDR